VVKGVIFDIKRYAIHDGPGIRTTVFFKGCPLDCWWCHNPESKNLASELMIKTKTCLSYCNECIKICPSEALYKIDNNIKFSIDNCSLCFKCVNSCPNETIRQVGYEITSKELLNEIKKDKSFFDESNGGVTISGGEPLLQIDFLEETIMLCKEDNLHVAIDTSGYSDFENFERILPYTDLFLYDIKFINEEKHIKYTGVSNSLILENLNKLLQKNIEINIRIPLIPDINSNEDIDDIISYLQKIRFTGKISILPYHKGADEKLKNLNKENKMIKTKIPNTNLVKEIKNRFIQNGFLVKIGG